jgi:protein gp37
MGAETGIAWTNHTFNPWWGCTKVSPGCDHCYAETFDKRLGGSHWGKDAPRRVFGDKHWNEPLRWNAAAQKAGAPALVFCASMADWCDVDAPPGAVERLHGLWRTTPWLRWQMLTKRPSRIAANLPADWGAGYPNVWLGTTVEDRRHGLPRIQSLRETPTQLRFLSIEPLLEDLGVAFHLELAGIDWVIVGGESGHHARPFHLAWARSIHWQCAGAGVAFFMKQLGAQPAISSSEAAGARRRGMPGAWRLALASRSGDDQSEWPEDLRVQQFPTFTR